MATSSSPTSSWLRRWLRPAAAAEPVLRWRVDAELWRDFVRHERQHALDDAAPALDWDDAAGEDGIEIAIEPEAVRVGRHRVALPRRGTPELLDVALQDTGPGPSTLALRLKYPAYGTSSGAVIAASYRRLAVPVPGSAWREARQAEALLRRTGPSTPDFFHGRGDGSDPEDLSRCGRCGWETHQLRSECERCGASLQSRRWSRRFGAGLVACGLFITPAMAMALWKTLPMLLHPGVDVGGGRFTGSPALAALVLLLMAAVLAFGAGTLGYGLWQVATGRRDLRLAMLLAGSFSFLLALARAIAD